MLDALIKEGRLLSERLQRHYDRGAEHLPPEERITESELEAWYAGVGEALEQQFGLYSVEVGLWRKGLERIRQEASEGVGRVTPRGGHWVLHNFSESLGVLAQIRLLRIGTETPSATTLAFSILHPTIAAGCRTSFQSGDYDAAVLTAFRAVEETIRGKVGGLPTDIGLSLVSKAMAPPTPRLRFSSIPPEQDAFDALYRGAIGAFKNPVSHRTVGHNDPVRVFELLALASLLMRTIDDLPREH